MPKFKPGVSGNPGGRPKGSQNETARLLKQMLDAHGPALLQKAFDLADGGNVPVIKLLLDRAAPPEKGHGIFVPVEDLKTVADLAEAHTRVLRALFDGEITTAAAAAACNILKAAGEVCERRDEQARIAKQAVQPDDGREIPPSMKKSMGEAIEEAYRRSIDFCRIEKGLPPR